MVALGQFPVSLDNSDDLKKVASSLNIPLTVLYPNLEAFSKDLPRIWLDIEQSGMFRPEYAEIIPPIGSESHFNARVHVATDKPNYSMGIQVDQRGDPSVELSITYPWLAFKPVLFSASIGRGLNHSKTVNAEIHIPRMFSRNVSLKIRGFSLLSDYSTANGFIETSKGVSAGVFGKHHSLELINAMRDVDISTAPASSRVDSVEWSQLKSQRISIKHTYSLQKLNFFRSNPTVPASGFDTKTVVDIPILLGDSESIRLQAIVSIYRRFLSGFVSRFYCKGSLAVNLLGIPEYAAGSHSQEVSESPRHRDTRPQVNRLPLMDRFFIGGVNDPFAAFHGFKDRSILSQFGGTSGFFSCGTSLSMWLPFIPITQLRGSCFAQTGLIVPQFESSGFSRGAILRSSVGLGLCIPVGSSGKFEVTLSWPFNQDDGQAQIFQVAITSQA